MQLLSEGKLLSIASQRPRVGRLSRCLLGMCLQEILLQAGPPAAPLCVLGSAMELLFQGEGSGSLCCLLQVTMTFNRQHLTVPEPLAALGEIMITREKSYYCHHAFIMQMILR